MKIMKLRKVFLLGVVLAGFTMIFPAAYGLVDGEKIIGPVMWAVVVLDGAKATLRVKKIEGCNVDTDALTIPVTGLPATTSDILDVRIESDLWPVFDLPCDAIVTKVKNFKNHVDLVSFDAQIKFITTDPHLTECAP